MPTMPTPGALTLTVSVDASTIIQLVQALIRLGTPHTQAVNSAHPPPGSRPGQALVAEDDPDEAPAIQSEADPPAATIPAARNGHAPAPTPMLPLKWRAKYFLGVLCKRSHEWHQSGQSLRKKSNSGCVECAARRPARAGPASRVEHGAGGDPRPAPYGDTGTTSAPVPAPTPVVQARAPAPPLPAYLAGAAYLSEHLCSNPAHRYRGETHTMRFLGTDVCVRCVSTQKTLTGP